MQLVGLALSSLVAIGAITGALVVVAYILKLKRKTVPVVFGPLWQRVLQDKDATSLFSQLKRLVSLLLQLVLLALLVLALADPRTASSLAKGRNLVVLIDASASMKSTDVAPSRIEVAREKVRSIVRSMGASDKALIVRMDASVTPLCTMTDEAAVLEDAIAQVHATDSYANFAQALKFSIDALQGLNEAEILVVSDGNLQHTQSSLQGVNLGDIKLSYLPIGEQDDAKTANVAITQFAVRRYPLDKSRYEVLIEVTNTSKKQLEVELSLLGDEQLVDVVRLIVQQGKRVSRVYPNLSGANRLLTARLKLPDGQRDALPVDDVAYALLPQRKRARVQCVTTGNTYLEAALLLDEFLQVTLVDPAAYPVEDQVFDVTIFDGVTPKVSANSGALFYIFPQGNHSPVAIDKGVLTSVGFDVWDKSSPLLRHTVVQNVNIAAALKLKPEKQDKVVGASFDGPLLVSGHRGDHPFVVLGFDIRQSDLPLRISWPLLLLNIINEFMHEDTSFISSYRTGSVWRIGLPSAGPLSENAWLVTPATPHHPATKHRVPVVQGDAVYLGQQAGVYQLMWGKDAPDFTDTSQFIEFAANLSDMQESTIAAKSELKVGNVRAGKLESFGIGVQTQLWIYFLLIAVVLSTIEWITYHRRITV